MALHRSLRRLLAVLGMFLVLEYLVLPQIAGVRKSLSLLGSANYWLVPLAVLLEAAAIAAYVQLTRAVLPSGRTSFWTTLRVDLSTLAVSHLVPGGAAAGTGLGYRLFVAAGVPGPDVGFALATQGMGSAVVLNVLLWVALAVSIPVRGFNPLYGTAAAVGLVLIGGFAGLVVLLTRGEARATRVFRAIARRAPFLDEDRVHRLVHRLAARLRTLAADRRLLVRAVTWATANWLLDAASLWVFIGAFGHRVGLDALLVAYGLANVLAAIPVTPGGLGVVEAVLTATLVGFGTPRGIAVLGVISYRLFNFWLPIPAGGLAYLSLKAGPGARARERAAELREVAEKSMEASEDAKTWALRHGVRVGRPTGGDGKGEGGTGNG